MLLPPPHTHHTNHTLHAPGTSFPIRHHQTLTFFLYPTQTQPPLTPTTTPNRAAIRHTFSTYTIIAKPQCSVAVHEINRMCSMSCTIEWNTGKRYMNGNSKRFLSLCPPRIRNPRAVDTTSDELTPLTHRPTAHIHLRVFYFLSKETSLQNQFNATPDASLKHRFFSNENQIHRVVTLSARLPLRGM